MTQIPSEPAVNSHPFRIGSVHYLNALPLTHGLGNDLVLLPPSKLAVEMHAGRLDAALLSITEALFHPEHEILDGVGILSRGPVYSVGLAHRQPLAAIQEIHLDTASCTSVNLLRVLLDRCGCHPRFVPLDNYASAPSLDNVLLIGNPAIDFRRTHGCTSELPGTTGHQWLDLGELWQAQEQLPFTYAAWVLRKDSPTALRRLLLDSAAQGLAALPPSSLRAASTTSPSVRSTSAVTSNTSWIPRPATASAASPNASPPSRNVPSILPAS